MLRKILLRRRMRRLHADEEVPEYEGGRDCANGSSRSTLRYFGASQHDQIRYLASWGSSMLRLRCDLPRRVPRESRKFGMTGERVYEFGSHDHLS